MKKRFDGSPLERDGAIGKTGDLYNWDAKEWYVGKITTFTELPAEKTFLVVMTGVSVLNHLREPIDYMDYVVMEIDRESEIFYGSE